MLLEAVEVWASCTELLEHRVDRWRALGDLYPSHPERIADTERAMIARSLVKEMISAMRVAAAGKPAVQREIDGFLPAQWWDSHPIATGTEARPGDPPKSWLDPLSTFGKSPHRGGTHYINQDI